MKAAAASISASKAGITQSASSHSGRANSTSLALPKLSVAPILSNGSGNSGGAAQSSAGSNADDKSSATPSPTASPTSSENAPATSASDVASNNAKRGDSQQAPASPAGSASATASGGDPLKVSFAAGVYEKNSLTDMWYCRAFLGAPHER
ncbi:hypothetical protein PYCCODRAFT_974906 [Trametes coccinea BRFM310]|uniref:Uncharacterized protein n=1 Tax=Trametes coccinea (strain BRFM310) TaxID=1353009 RepID=A0A1Y2IBT0_TRAC3|nr:hypothetical protein PYCCODRAFT_974906 [Trametes coccinea BRFM310]